MIDKQQIYLHEFNLLMDRSIYLPAVSGLLHAYADTFPDIKKNYSFASYIFIRDKIKNLIQEYDNPSVACFSVSMWNINLSLSLAKEIKRKFPNCLIVFGGASAPFDAEIFFNKNPCIDISVRGEGEQTFVEILKRNLVSKDFSDIPGISWRDKNNNYIKNIQDPIRQKDLDVYPCAYVGGYFDDILKNHKNISFQSIVETNRGCPFNCHYCFWGMDGLAKRINHFSLDRIKKTIDWCGRNKIKYVFCADANFGMFDKDYDIAKFLVETNKKYNYPEKFRVCYSKNQGENVYKIGKLLADNKLEKGITMSFQSLDKQTLVNVGRKNIKLSVFNELQRRYNQDNIPTYTELIFGMPGETYSTFRDGLEETLSSSSYCQLFIYFCLVLENTEISKTEYIKRFNVGISALPISEIHTLPREKGIVKEYENIITSHSSMTTKEWKNGAVLMWTLQSLHGLKLCFYVLSYLKHRFNIKYTDILEYIILQNKNNNYSFIKGEIDYLYSIADGILEGKERGQILPDYGKIYWDVEEASYLRIAEKLNIFFDELYSIVIDYLNENMISYNSIELKEVFDYQLLRTPTFLNNELDKDFSYNIPEYFDNLFSNNKVELVKKPQKLFLTDKVFYNRLDFAQEIVLFGRKSNDMICSVRWENVNA